MSWREVVTHPLGLVAFALALVFGAIGARSRNRNKPWLLPMVLTIAALVIAGGLFLAYQDIGAKGVGQQTQGDHSPAVQGVVGDVTIVHNQDGKGK